MPVVAPLIAFAGSAAGAATIGAGIGAAGTMYAANQANKATQQQIQASQSAANQNYQLQQQALQAALQNNAPFLQGGAGALAQLQQVFGLGAGGATPTSSGGGATPNYDVASYLQQNPDVEAARQQIMASGNIGPGKEWATFEDWVAREQIPNAQAAGEQRAYPAAQQPVATQQPGTGANYGPTIAPRPDFGAAPSLPSLTADLYRESPGYQNRLREAGRTTNAQFAARGLLGSGAAATEFGRRMQSIADEDYNNWVNQQLGLYDRSVNQYNINRQFGTGVYDADRNYLTSRFDTNVNDLFRLAGLGQASANQATAAQGNYAANVGNQANTLANQLSNAYGQQAQNNATAWGNIAGIGQNLLGMAGQRSQNRPMNSQYNWSPDWGGGS